MVPHQGQLRQTLYPVRVLRLLRIPRFSRLRETQVPLSIPLYLDLVISTSTSNAECASLCSFEQKDAYFEKQITKDTKHGAYAAQSVILTESSQTSFWDFKGHSPHLPRTSPIQPIPLPSRTSHSTHLSQHVPLTARTSHPSLCLTNSCTFLRYEQISALYAAL